ncbi:protein of unknown function [Salinimicrobium catena]|uniref:DUF4258 domain-containing protein n=1 Tax=Salinimicrobium catena TaxID=390640 RepID=A0A1H5M7Y2_9FLAO|nr:DUF4258 domain-containing protein [Salinimicrobium catena]SDL19816.1 protein of unknown function [Salinimicrobium catena]SEE85415.1 protein of unknown function [Salinimicrobium catena]
MKFIHRLGYYLGGFSIGLVILAFFLSGKKTSCDYTPDARVLKNIRIKERAYTEQALERMEMYQVDTSDISTILKKGDVDFSRSNTKLDSCKTYLVTGRSQIHNLELLFENCDSVATLQKVDVVN